MSVAPTSSSSTGGVPASAATSPTPVPTAPVLGATSTTMALHVEDPTPSLTLPVRMLGNVNPRASRRYNVPAAHLSGGALTTATIDANTAPTMHVNTYDFSSTTRYKSVTKGWSVHGITDLEVVIQPFSSAKSHFAVLYVAWVPKGEDLPTDVDSFYDYQLSSRVHMFPMLTGGVAPPITFKAPIGQADLVGYVKPKPVAGGIPQLCIGCVVRDKDDHATNAFEFAAVNLIYHLHLGA